MSNRNSNKSRKNSTSGEVLVTNNAPPDTSLRKGVIYMYVFPNKKKYVGQSWDMKKRHNSHRGDAKRGKKTYFYTAIRKHGMPPYIILKVCYSQDDLNACEIAFINMYKVRNRKYGYNDKAGGRGGTHSDTTKEVIRQKAIEQFSNPENRKKAAIYGAMADLNEDVRRRMSISHMGEKNPFFGKKHPPEIMDRIKQKNIDNNAKKYNITNKGRDCSGCGAWLEWKHFGINRAKSTGRKSMCKGCEKLMRQGKTFN